MSPATIDTPRVTNLPDRHALGLVPFSCKRETFCASCGARWMEVVADHWLERVLPRVAYRQWVLTLPWPRRGLLVYRPESAGGLLGVAIKVISRWCRRDVPSGKTGDLSVIHRFDSMLRHNLRFHILMPDGAWVRDGDRGLVFRRYWPTTGNVVDIVEQIAPACEGWLTAQGYGAEEVEELLVDEDDTRWGTIVRGRAR